MNLILKLSTLATSKLIDGACEVVGVTKVGQEVVAVRAFLKERFTDHSQILVKALRSANERAWRALELSLAGESLWERCKAATARTEDKSIAQQVRDFLDKAKLPASSADAAFRQKCLQELRAARKADLLTSGVLHPQELAEQTAAFARFSDPQSLIDGEGQIIKEIAQELKEAGYSNLALLITQRPSEDRPLLVIAARYFFRRAVEENAKLFQGLAFAQLERLGKEQEEGFASLHTLMSQQGQRLEDLLADVHAKVIETHSAVLDLQGQIEGQTGQLQEIGVAVQKLLEQHQLHRREVRPSDSLSIRNDNERELVKQLVARYRALPEEERRQVPALLNGIGKLEVVAGDFDAARKDFAAVATLVEDNKVQAEAHFNAYQACLERRDWPAAIQEFIKAVKLDAKRFASFPVGKYQPQRILGAGGFGVAFLCKHKYMDAQVVVKTLMLEDLGRDADKVFMEAQVLRQLEHPAIIRISDCGYVDSTNRSRPFLVMDYFEGGTLEEHVKKHGPLSVEDLLAVARPVAEGLQAAHGKGILHRDVKPANLLVRKNGANWQVKVIDFGLALRQKVVKTSMSTSTSKRSRTLVGGSIAGTLDYGAPEQMGKRDDAVGPYSDVYGWAKTCCYALFQTTQPLFTHWQSIPLPLAQVLERCLSEDPAKRPQSFAEVLEGMSAVSASSGREIRQPVETPTFHFEEPAAEIVKRESSRSQRRKHQRSKLPLLIGGGTALAALALVLLFTVVLRSKTKAGMLVVEVDQPGDEVIIDGKQSTITQPGGITPVANNLTNRPASRSAKQNEVTTTPSPTNLTNRQSIPTPPATARDDAEQVGEIRRFEGHAGQVWGLAVSPDGRQALSGCKGSPSGGSGDLLWLWDVESSSKIRPFRGHTETIMDVAFSPDGRRAASGSEDKTVRIWDVRTGRELHCLKKHTARITGVSFSRDGKRLLSSSDDKSIRQWDVDSGTEIARYQEPLGAALSVRYFPDGHRFLSATGVAYSLGKSVPAKEYVVRIWDGDNSKNH